MVVLSAVVLAGSRWLAYQFRFDFDVPTQYQIQIADHWHWVIALQLGCLFLAGQFSDIYRYFSISEALRLAYAMLASSTVLYTIRWLDVSYSPPRGVVMVQGILGLLALGGMRGAWRVAYERYYSKKGRLCSRERRVAIIGAGDAAASLIRDLRAYPRLGLIPVALFDDDPHKWRARLHGIRIVGPPEHIHRIHHRLAFEEVIIALPSASTKRLAEIVSLLQKHRIKHVTIPGIDQLTAGNVSISQLRNVRIEDVLGRDPVDLRTDDIRSVLKGQIVLITGAGGSIGSELCRQIARFDLARLLLLEQSEVQLFPIEQELIQRGHGSIIQALIADILDQTRIRAIFAQHRPSVIFHAAAHKHVPLMEAQPSEAIKNNVFGTVRLAEMALEHGVERFLMISTDKAVNPTSVMGASKRLAEVFLQAFAERHRGKTRFAAVRFGNVLGSSGSVVPIFEQQIARGGPVTVTHPDVVRYFMTIPEAVGLVLQSSALGTGGDIFVLDMGKPVKIADLARQMIRLSGLEPDRDIEIQFVGLRPGEKLFEELKHIYADCTGTVHPRILRLTNPPTPLEEVRASQAKLQEVLDSATPEQFRSLIAALLPEYTPWVSQPGQTAPFSPLAQADQARVAARRSADTPSADGI
jgi:FlaA1/EpsC-like NDP-sugar epimerase